MRILVIDDNIAIQEILSEILTAEGHEVTKAGTFDGAAELIETSDPQIIFLDSSVEDQDGIKLLDRLNPQSTAKAVVITKNRNLTADSPFVAKVVLKPFKSSDIIDSVREISEGMEKPLKDRLFKIKLFSKPMSEEDSAAVEEDTNIRFGKSYIVFEDDPQIIYHIASNLSRTCNLMMITTGKVKAISDRFADHNVKVIGLSAKARFGYIEMSRLGTLMNSISEFVSNSAKPVVVFDDIEQLIAINGLNTVLTMINQIIDKKTLTVAASIDGDSINEKEKELILNYMEEYQIRKE